MKFEIGNTYKDRAGNEWRHIAGWGPLPKFEDVKTGKVIVQNPDGGYRWDGEDAPRDMVGEA